jgi:hypothetical protein
MSKSNLVRTSRAGDQFHYLWAARRCLRLLSPNTGLVAITIEGASPSEHPAGQPVDSGEEVIDVGEYYGSENIEHASFVRYIQLKHSTVRTDEQWTLSGLDNTLKKFAQRYQAHLQRFGKEVCNGKFEFCFATNRPISTSVIETLEDAVSGTTARHPKTLKALKQITALANARLSEFCKMVRVQGGQEGYWDQRNVLFQDVSGYLPDADVDAPVQLKELVTQKALPQSEKNPTITKHDVLRALKTDEHGMFPAPCLIN